MVPLKIMSQKYFDAEPSEAKKFLRNVFMSNSNKKDYKIPKLKQNGQKIGQNRNFPEK